MENDAVFDRKFGMRNLERLDVMDILTLDAYAPRSRLSVRETSIAAPACPAFDFHMHFGELLLGKDYTSAYDTGQAVEALKAKGLFGAVNLDGGWGDELARMLDKIGDHRDFIHTFGSVDLEQFEKPDYEGFVHRTIRDGKANGIRGLKFWKILGLSIRDSQDRYLKPDDPRLKPIWQSAAEFGLPILIHIADPVAFFDPLDAFNERYEELQENPDWHFHGGGRYTFEELMECQESLLAENPRTTFVIAHVGSYSENLEQVGRWLDSYPNMYVDTAQRISELGRQPYSSKRFFERFPDRILFGTDSTPVSMDLYEANYRFLETEDEYFSYGGGQGRWNIYGIGLEADVLAKVYRENAKKVLGV